MPRPRPETVPDPIEVAIDAPELCPDHPARVIRGVRVGPSPGWMVRRLEAVGLRSIDNVVDVTTHMLTETGQPLHALDLAKLSGPRLVARTALGESMVAIDGKELTCKADDRAICYAERPVALAGKDSEVGDSTTDVVLECALFAPLSVRESSKRHQIRSDSSFRFERFVDPRGDALPRGRMFLDCALMECVTEPFVGEGVEDVAMDRAAAALRGENPMRAEESLLQRSLVGTLLRVARGNAHRGNRGLRLFEIAPVYVRGDGTPAAGDTNTFELLLGVASIHGDYADAKGIAETVLSVVGWEDRVRFEKGAPASFATCRGARLMAGDTTIGHVVELDAAARDRFGLMEATTVLALDVGRLVGDARPDATCTPVSRHPAVDRDLDLVVDESVTWAQLVGCVRDGAGDLLESVEPFDIYRGDTIGRGKKSVTLRMWLRADDRTLTAAEADERVQRILTLAGERTGGVLRS